MPPFRRFWLYYLGLVAIAAGLLGVGYIAFFAPPGVSQDSQIAPPTTAYILAAGVVVAVLSIVTTSISSWRATRVQQTFTALQTLRTDREYLINALRVEAEPGLTLGQPLSGNLRTLFKTGTPSSDVDNPSFGQASRFLLNQYEFIAAATRLGQMDEEMLRNTIKSAFGNLVRTFAPVISERRQSHPESMANLVWLYQQMCRDTELDLGPGQSFAGTFWQRVGKILGVVPYGR